MESVEYYAVMLDPNTPFELSLFDWGHLASYDHLAGEIVIRSEYIPLEVLKSCEAVTDVVIMYGVPTKWLSWFRGALEILSHHLRVDGWLYQAGTMAGPLWLKESDVELHINDVKTQLNKLEEIMCENGCLSVSLGEPEP